jgi:FkbM family methyltransferase
MSVKKILGPLFRKIGYDIVTYNPKSNSIAREKKLLESYGIDLVLDVGANTGKYAQKLRRQMRYKNKIISFEPLSEAYQALATKAKKDRNWETMHCALGGADCNMEIHVAGNSYSSSILEMLPAHEKSAPQSKYVGRESIEVKTLDTIFGTLGCKKQNILLKLDTQGYEKHVLEGAKQTLPLIDSIKLEASLVPLYEGEFLFHELCSLLYAKGYRLVSIQPGFYDKHTGELLQIDGFFHRFQEQ